VSAGACMSAVTGARGWGGGLGACCRSLAHHLANPPPPPQPPTSPPANSVGLAVGYPSLGSPIASSLHVCTPLWGERAGLRGRGTCTGANGGGGRGEARRRSALRLVGCVQHSAHPWTGSPPHDDLGGAVHQNHGAGAWLGREEMGPALPERRGWVGCVLLEEGRPWAVVLSSQVLKRCPNDIARGLELQALQDRNETLFFRLLIVRARV
jgi:hypothetical protein